MKTKSLLIALTMLCVCLVGRTAPAPPVNPARSPARYVEGELLVKFRGGPRGDGAARTKSAMKHEVKRHFDFIGWQQIKLPAGMTVEEGLRRYKNHPDVLAAEPNMLKRAIEPVGVGASMLGPKPALRSLPDDPLVPQQWALEMIGAPHACPHRSPQSCVLG